MPLKKRISAAALSLMMLSACATPASPPLAGAPVEQPEPATTAATSPADPKPEPASNVKPVLSAGALIGMEPGEVQNIFGSVSLKRWEGAAQVMQFSSAACVIDIYFYEKAPGEAFEASFIEARNHSGDSIEGDTCVAALLAEAH